MILRHDEKLATSVKDANAIPLLVICLSEQQISLKRIAANALSEIAKHSATLA